MDMLIDIHKIYPWITQKLLCDILESFERKASVTITEPIYGTLALPKGENYCSDIIRIVIKYTSNGNNFEKETSFVLKASIPNEECKRLDKTYEFFLKEITIFKEIHPLCENLLRSAGINDQLGPRFLANDAGYSAMLTEDLLLRGYRNVDKRFGLDLIHFKVALKKLAWWHATTAILVLRDRKMFKTFLKPAIRTEMDITKALLTNVLTDVAHVASQWQGFETISTRLLKIKERLFEKVCDDFICREEEFNVITHGDIWSNNIMYRYDENGLPVDALMVDYTVGCLTSPGKDLTYLLFTSSSSSVRESEWDLLIQYYHEKLSLMLNKLDYPRRIPTLNDIQVSFIQRGTLSALYGFFITGLRFGNETKSDGLLPFVSINNRSDEEFRFRMYSNPDCEQTIKFLLDYLSRKGFFDI